MSNSVDNRVVSMEFDNAKFERNVAQSLETLKHLDKSLDGLSNSSKKFDGVSFEDVANSIESLASRFTLSGRIIQKVFDDIAQGIVNVGHKLINFSLEGVTSGWDKYAEKTTSVQTIMSATGQSIEEVETQLDRLNRFTDETSYNFTDMTSNIAKFTSQGIGLDTAVTQMQGIATWAASAGQNAQAASRAMYNISQAMGAGSMKLIDWKSIQNANMATKEFKEQAIAAGVAAGTLVDQEGKIVTATGDIEVSTKNFEQTLQKGWFNTEAMQKVFSDYGKFADTVDEVYEAFDENFSVSKLMQWSEELDSVGDSAEEAAAFQEKLGKESGLTGQELDDLTESLKKLNSEELKFSRATYKAAQEAKTLGDAIDATRDAVSTAWMNLYQSLFGNYEEQRHLWTDMANWWYDLFAEPVNGITDTVKTVMENTRFVKDAKGTIEDFFNGSTNAGNKYGSTMVNVLKKSGLLTDDMIKEAGSLEKAMSGVGASADDIKKTIDEMLSSNTAGAKTAGEALEDYTKLAAEIWQGKWSSGSERKNMLEAAGFDYNTAQYFAELRREGIAPTEADLWRLAETSSQLTDDQKEQLIALRKAIEDSGGSIEDLFETFDIFDSKYDDWTGRELLFGRDANGKEGGKRGAIYDAIDIINSIGDAISGAWNEIFDINYAGAFRMLLVNFKSFTQSIKDAIGDGENLKRTFKGLFAVLDIGKTAFSAVFKGFKQVISLFVPAQLGIGGMAASVGDWLVSIRDYIKENKVFENAVKQIVNVFSSFRNALQPAIDRVKELWEVFKASNGLQRIASFFSNTFRAAMDIASVAVEKVAHAFDTLILTIVDFYNTYLSKYVGQLVTFFSNLANGSITIKGEFEKIKNALQDFFSLLLQLIKTRDINQFFQNFSNRFKGLAEWIGKTKKSIEEWFGQFDKETVNTVLKLVTALITFIGVLKILKSFKSLKSSLSSFLDSISSSIKSFVRNYKVNTVLKIAASIGILVGALVVLAYMPAEKMKQGMQALIAIMTMFLAITIVAAAIGIKANPKTMIGLGATLGALVAGLLAAAIAIQILTTKVDYNNIWRALGVLFAVLTSLVASTILVSRLAGKATIKMTGILALGAGVLLMVLALKEIQDSSDELTPDAFEKFFAIIALLIASSFALRGVSVSSALGLLLFVMSLSKINKLLLAFLDEMPEKSEYQKRMDDFLELMKMLGSIALVLRVAGKGGLRAAIGMLAMIAGIYALSKVAADLGKLPPAQITNGVYVVTAIGDMLSALLVSMGIAGKLSAGSKGFSTAVIAIVVALIAIGIELAVLGKMGWDEILPGIAAIGTIFLGLSAVMLSASKLAKDFDPNGLKSLTMILGILAGVFLALWGLSKLANSDALLECAVSLGVTMIALAAAMKIISTIDFGKSNWSTIGMTVVEMAAFLGLVSVALWALSAIPINDQNSFITKVVALGAIMLALAISMRIVGNLDIFSYDWNSLGIVVVEMLAFLALSFAALAAVNALQVQTDTILTKVAALSLIMIATAVALRIVSDNSGLAMTATDAARAFVLAIAGLVIIVASIGALDELFGFGEALKGGATILGEALGAFIGGIAVGITESAITCADNLAKFIEHLQPFLEGLKGVDESSTEKMTSLGTLLVTLAKAEIGNAIANVINNWAGADDGSLLDRLTGFAEAVNGYVMAVQGLSETDVDKAAKITDSVSTLLNAIPKEGGVAGWLLGKKSDAIKNLSDNLSGFGSTIVNFGNELSSISDSTVANIQKASDAMTPLAELIDKMPKSGGVWQSIIGEADISAFGTKMTTFVRCLVGGLHNDGLFNLLGLIKDEDREKIARLSNVTQDLTAAIEPIPTMGGLISQAFGSNDPTTFGSEIKTYIEQILEIGEKASGITADTITAIQNAASAAQALYIFNAATNGQLVAPDTANAEAAVEVTDKMTEAVDTVKEMDVESAKPKVDAFYNMLNPGEGFSLDTISASIETAVDGIGNVFTSKQGVVATAIGGFMDGMTTSIATKQPELEATMTAMTTSVTSNLDTLTQDAETAYQTSGSNIAIAFANGLNSSEAISTIQETAKNLINSAIQTMETTAKIEDGSTSTEAKEVGKIFGNSFVKGLDEKKDKVKEKAVDMVKSLIQGFTERQADAGAAGQEMVDSFLTPFTTAIDALAEQSGLKVEEIYAILSQGVVDAGTAGTDTATSYSTNVEAGESEAETAANTVATSAVQALDNAKSGAEIAGNNFSLGFAAGITAYLGEIISAAAAAAQAALDAVQSTIDSHSPSKETQRLGSFFGEGFAMGIKSMTSFAGENAAAMADNALNAVSEAARLASEIVESDANPVITPILDMSEVRSGMAGMSNLGSFAATVSASKANMAYDSAQIREIQNGTSGPVTAVLSESAARALAGSRQSSNKTVIEFTGDLAQLARVLHPVIVDQYNYHGDSLIK